MRRLYLALAPAIAGCAQAGPSQRIEADADATVVRPDGSTTPVDAAVTTPDSQVGCTMVTQNLLMNPAFDATPAGTGWIADPIDATYPIVTDDAGPVGAQSAGFRAWMGGFEVVAANNKDTLHQDVAIPASTTQLVFKGYYELRSDEFTAGVYDSATIELTSTTGTQLQLLDKLDDNEPTTAWTQLTVPVTANVNGQTIRLRLSTTSDGFDVTSFFFDTLELSATFCQ